VDVAGWAPSSASIGPLVPADLFERVLAVLARRRQRARASSSGASSFSASGRMSAARAGAASSRAPRGRPWRAQRRRAAELRRVHSDGPRPALAGGRDRAEGPPPGVHGSRWPDDGTGQRFGAAAAELFSVVWSRIRERRGAWSTFEPYLEPSPSATSSSEGRSRRRMTCDRLVHRLPHPSRPLPRCPSRPRHFIFCLLTIGRAV
jgi:hypothetical protein